MADSTDDLRYAGGCAVLKSESFVRWACWLLMIQGIHVPKGNLKNAVTHFKINTDKCEEVPVEVAQKLVTQFGGSFVPLSKGTVMPIIVPLTVVPAVQNNELLRHMMSLLEHNAAHEGVAEARRKHCAACEKKDKKDKKRKSKDSKDSESSESSESSLEVKASSGSDDSAENTGMLEAKEPKKKKLKKIKEELDSSDAMHSPLTTPFLTAQQETPKEKMKVEQRKATAGAQLLTSVDQCHSESTELVKLIEQAKAALIELIIAQQTTAMSSGDDEAAEADGGPYKLENKDCNDKKDGKKKAGENNAGESNKTEKKEDEAPQK
eukprot:m51a1_g7924 hypothetical protein (322) ;mRNA; f:34511-35926